MGRETKLGLLVGLAFIVLFGLILSVRGGTEPVKHAALPTGESRGHVTMVRSILMDVDPFVEQSVLEVANTGPAEAEARSPEEPMPAPESVQTVETPERITNEYGTVAAVLERNSAPAERLLAPGESPGAKGLAAGEPTEASPPALRTYKVRTNDTLIRIARRFYGSGSERLWRRVYEANKQVLADPDRLAPGQELVIPGLCASPDPAPAPDGVRTVTAGELARMFGSQSDLVEVPSAPPTTYTVREGDTFYSIAQKLYGEGRLGKLLHLRNKHLVPDPRRLRVGQRILLLDGEEIRREPADLEGMVALR
ncbi:MAG: LysM peptidoglycan-binding domain-containing protein [Phycisphaerae bacterium]